MRGAFREPERHPLRKCLVETGGGGLVLPGLWMLLRSTEKPGLRIHRGKLKVLPDPAATQTLGCFYEMAQFCVLVTYALS